MVSASFDWQPRLSKNNAPFYTLGSRGWNINFVQMVYRLKSNYEFGLNFNLSRLVEECGMQNISDPIIEDIKLKFKLKSIAPRIGIIVQKKFKSLSCFISANIGVFFDDEFAWRYHYSFTNVSDTINFRYSQHYTVKKIFPVMVQIGVMKSIGKKLFIRGLIYNHEYKTTFTQDYSIQYHQVVNKQSSTNDANRFGVNIGVGYQLN